ncbi:hypothetical protein H2204_013205 [Knufia peltigerae]|uniref:Uncharacterized protein n=1 Tax=Knufia peltigerae TaxID=1002370 RepID=A0AA38XR04_9EURO|nr:hypothetical protein H2204_013205 [Knufia peltigerae]
MTSKAGLGLILPHGCRITHGTAACVKKPFRDIDITMNNLTISTSKTFRGQLGWMEFTSNVRLPRHLHMDLHGKRLLDERILVLNGVGLVELAGEYYVVAPGSLVDIRGGVPHTWTACPAGVKLPDGTISNNSFLMVYEYEDETTFFPTADKDPINSVSDYKPFSGQLQEIRFPNFSAQDVARKGLIVFNEQKVALELA